MTTPTPPEGGWKIIPPEYLKDNPLPKDAFIEHLGHWYGTIWRGKMLDTMRLSYTYATREPLPCFTPEPDWRKLCEELVVSACRYKEFCKPHCVGGMDAKLALDVALTRAKTALEESK